jgi:hypothetical protein
VDIIFIVPPPHHNSTARGVRKPAQNRPCENPVKIGFLDIHRFLTDVLALVHDVSNRTGIVAAGNTVALLVVDLMYGAIVNAVNYNTSIAS